jgi:glycosyltransferase involved in cell wall biosynthesis
VASNHRRREFQNNGVSQEKLHLVPLPVEEIGAREVALSRKKHQGRILFSGRLTDLKGVGHLMQAIPRAAHKLGRCLTLTIAGDGPEREKLQKLASGLDIDAEFVGWVGTRQKFDLMRQADLLCVPSLWPEPFGLVGVEAACFGLPAVGYAVGGIPEWLIPGKTGELAPANPPTVDGLADAIVSALADPDHYAELCRGAWNFSRQFSVSSHLDRLEPILVAAAFNSSARETAALISQVQ